MVDAYVNSFFILPGYFSVDGVTNEVDVDGVGQVVPLVVDEEHVLVEAARRLFSAGNGGDEVGDGAFGFYPELSQ